MKGRGKYGESEYDEEEDGENTMTMSGGESDGAAADTLRRMQQVSKQVKERVKGGQARPLKASEGRANDGRKWVRGGAAGVDDGQNGSRRTGSLDESGKLKSYADAVMDQNRSAATSGQISAAARVTRGGRPAVATADAEDDGDFWAVGGSSASSVVKTAPVSTNAGTKIVVSASEGARGEEGSVAVPNQWTTSTSKRRNKKRGGVRQEEVEVMKGG
ncbi:hypothetical protein BZA70DRAFT_284403 [Myxozyma melibiosi]|uniref:Uncharacterized protein n=1 Tax=Myxozyma melibiosi TaxID=54550 RepID=A0ABR1EZE3_9ASCO